MEDINISEWKRKLLMENQEVDPAKDHFSKAEDNLYKKVTGEEPKASTKNKFRDIKEGEDKTYTKHDIIDMLNEHIGTGEGDIEYNALVEFKNWVENEL
jgi:hypothetical protein